MPLPPCATARALSPAERTELPGGWSSSSGPLSPTQVRPEAVIAVRLTELLEVGFVRLAECAFPAASGGGGLLQLLLEFVDLGCGEPGAAQRRAHGRRQLAVEAAGGIAGLVRQVESGLAQ